MEGARPFSVMSIAKLPFPRILRERAVLIWSTALPEPLVPAVGFWDHPVVGVRGPANPLVTWALRSRSQGELWGSVTEQLPSLSWISLEFP